MTSDRFDEYDERWRIHEDQLLRDLRDRVGLVRRDFAPEPGSKGTVESIIIALGSAGAITAAFECLQAWLNRDRTRRIKLSWTVNGQTDEVSLETRGISRKDFARLTRAAGLIEEE